MKRFQWKFQVFKLSSAKQTSDITHPNVCKEFDLIIYNFKAIIASRGYHVYKETSWSNAKTNEEVKVELETNTTSFSADPYACAIKTKNPYFSDWKTVGHIPREISRYVYFFIEEENGNVSGTIKSLKCKSFPIPSGGLKVPLLLKFFAKDKWVVDNMEKFVLNFTVINTVEISQLLIMRMTIRWQQLSSHYDRFRRNRQSRDRSSIQTSRNKKSRNRNRKSVEQHWFTNKWGHTSSNYNRLMLIDKYFIYF